MRILYNNNIINSSMVVFDRALTINLLLAERGLRVSDQFQANLQVQLNIRFYIVIVADDQFPLSG